MGMVQSEAADGARRIMEVAMIGVEGLPEEGTGPKNERSGHSRNLSSRPHKTASPGLQCLGAAGNDPRLRE